MRFKKFLICSGSLLVLSAAAYLIACGGFFDPDTSYQSYFRQDILEKNTYYYSYLNWYDNEPDKQSDRVQNIQEWKKQLGGKVSDKDIAAMIYDISLNDLQQIQSKARLGLWTKIDKQWLNNGMMRRIVQQTDLNLLNYLLYAKSCEQQAGKRAEEWGDYYDRKKQDSLLRRGIQYYKASKTEFTKLRYAFQVVRMAFYCDRKADCVRYYREMVEPSRNKKALAKLWAMAFYAGATESIAEAAYCYSLVFDRCPRYSMAAMTSCRWLMRDANPADIIPFCNNKHEKAVVHAIWGMNCFQPTLEPLQQVYQLEPKSPYMETLLVREINKIEDALSAGNDANDAVRDQTVITARALQNLAAHYAGLKSVQRPALWYAAAAYLAYLAGDFEQATILIVVAEREPTDDAKITEQLLAIKLLMATKDSAFDAHAEAYILPSIQWLLEKVQDTTLSRESHRFFDRTAAHYFAEKLPELYLSRQQTVKAALCIGIAKRYTSFAMDNYAELDAFRLLDGQASIDQLKEMQQQMAATDQLNAYDACLYARNQQDGRLTGDAIRELTGSKYMRTLRFEEAAACFKQLSGASKLFHLDNNPFDAPPLAGRKSAPAQEGKSFHSKLSFAHEMADLQQKINKNRATPKDLFRYACGLYQMSWCGNSWQLLSYDWSSAEEWESERKKPEAEWHHYYHTDLAQDFFMQAFKQSHNNEFKAQCLFMATHCYQMSSSNIFVRKNGRNTFGNYFHNNPYFSQLTKKYRKTDFYKHALTRCSYLSDFAKHF